jgi:hypothetical protein
MTRNGPDDLTEGFLFLEGDDMRCSIHVGLSSSLSVFSGFLAVL